MMRRLFSPRWILIHLGVALLIYTMVSLGFWQLSRLDQKRVLNSAIATRTAAPISPLTNDDLDTNDEWRRVTVSGNYVVSKPVTIINRSTNGTAGYDSVVPFRTTFGSTILVNRGFVPLVQPNPLPTTEPVTLLGFLRASQKRSALGAIDSVDPSNSEFQRFDIPLIMNHVGEKPFPMFVQLIQERPASTDSWPAKVALPELTEGTHLSYAMQWFFFSGVALTAWVIVVRKKLRETAKKSVVPSETSA